MAKNKTATKGAPVQTVQFGSIEWRGKNKDIARLVITHPCQEAGQRKKVYENLGRISPKEAEAKRVELFIKYQSPTNSEEQTFGQLVDRWKSLRWQIKELKPKTIQRYNELLDQRILPLLKDKRLKDIKPSDIEKLLVDIKNGERKDTRSGQLSSRTILHYYVLLRSIFAYAHANQDIPCNPVRKELRPIVKQARIKSYNREETMQLLSTLSKTDLMHQSIISLTLAIGCRLGEITGLRWRDVDLENGIVSIRTTRQYIDKENGILEGKPKTDKSERDCDIPPSVVKMLSEYKSEITESLSYLGIPVTNDTHVFVNFEGKALHPSSPNRWLKEFLLRHKLPKLTFHGLRHTCATLLIAEGMDVAAIAELLGHSTPATTLNYYVHSTTEAKKRVVSIMDTIISTSVKADKDASVPTSSPAADQ